MIYLYYLLGNINLLYKIHFYYNKNEMSNHTIAGCFIKVRFKNAIN